MSYFNMPAETAADAKHNPLRTLKAIARREDFVVIKIDIDHSPTELALVQQILAEPEISNLIDELYFEHHVMQSPLNACCWGYNNQGDVASSYDLFANLRKLGIRALVGLGRPRARTGAHAPLYVQSLVIFLRLPSSRLASPRASRPAAREGGGRLPGEGAGAISRYMHQARAGRGAQDVGTYMDRRVVRPPGGGGDQQSQRGSARRDLASAVSPCDWRSILKTSALCATAGPRGAPLVPASQSGARAERRGGCRCGRRRRPHWSARSVVSAVRTVHSPSRRPSVSRWKTRRRGPIRFNMSATRHAAALPPCCRRRKRRRKRKRKRRGRQR